MENMLCKCGSPALYNHITKEWEMCLSCRSAIYGNSSVEDLLYEMGFGSKYCTASLSDFKNTFIDQMKLDTCCFTKNLHLSGSSAVGKTYLMAGIARELLNTSYTHKQMSYMNTMSMYIEIGADIKKVNYFIDVVGSVPILFLDEVVPHKTEWEYRTLYMILENRRNNDLVTISASNCSLDKLDGRIVSRLINDGIEYKMSKNTWMGK